MQLSEELDGLRAGPVVERQRDQAMAARPVDAGGAAIANDEKGSLLVALARRP
jgi:hypothetical protein